MSASPDKVRLVRQWIEKAEHDLRNAEHTLTLKDDCPFDTICFHAQQCAEKYLKALLVFYEADFPKTHDLVLLENLAIEVAPGLKCAQLCTLNRYSAKKAVAIAIQVRDAVRFAFPGDVIA